MSFPRHLQTPWDFPDEHDFEEEIRDQICLRYKGVQEIGMGGPLQGNVQLIKSSKHYKVADLCGGPPLLDEDCRRIAVPKWTSSLWKGTHQRLLVLDLEKLQVKPYERKFDVLDIQSFNGSIIQMFDGSQESNKKVELDLRREKVKETYQLEAMPS